MTVSVSFDPVAEFVKVFDDEDADDVVVPHKPLKIVILPNNSRGEVANLSFIMKDNDNNEGNKKGTATAKLTGYVDGTTELTLEDDEQTLTLAVDPDQIYGGGGTDRDIELECDCDVKACRKRNRGDCDCHY